MAQADLDAEVEVLMGIHDPSRQARHAGMLLDQIEDRIEEIRLVRKAAVKAMKDEGMTYRDIGAEIGLSHTRVQQILDSGGRPGKAFLGGKKITIAVGGAAELDPGSRPMAVPVVSQYAMSAYETLSTLSKSHSIEVELEIVPPPGQLRLARSNLIVLTSPKRLPVLSGYMITSRYQFKTTPEGCWYMVDSETGREFRSPIDNGEAADYAFIGRLPRPDERGSFLYLAGVHGAGTLGAAVHLAQNLEEMWRLVGRRSFDAIIRCTYDPDRPLVITSTELLGLHKHGTP